MKIKKILEIVQAWNISLNPSPEEIEISEHRAAICQGCEFISELDNSLIAHLSPEDALLVKFKCTACGCPLAKKIFSNFKESCPKNKWEK